VRGVAPAIRAAADQPDALAAASKKLGHGEREHHGAALLGGFGELRAEAHRR
jgi:hypothetical protein